MPKGDAERIRNHLCLMVDEACSYGRTSVSIRAGDIRDTIKLNYPDAIIDICQVLDTEVFKKEAGVTFLKKTGPNQGVDTVYEFDLL